MSIFRSGIVGSFRVRQSHKHTKAKKITKSSKSKENTDANIVEVAIFSIDETGDIVEEGTIISNSQEE